MAAGTVVLFPHHIPAADSRRDERPQYPVGAGQRDDSVDPLGERGTPCQNGDADAVRSLLRNSGSTAPVRDGLTERLLRPHICDIVAAKESGMLKWLVHLWHTIVGWIHP